MTLIVQDGESNWMEGMLLLVIYLILGLTFYFLPETTVAPARVVPAAGVVAPH